MYLPNSRLATQGVPTSYEARSTTVDLQTLPDPRRSYVPEDPGKSNSAHVGIETCVR